MAMARVSTRWKSSILVSSCCGEPTLLTNRHLWPTIEKARAAGARLVVIDPVKTITADAVDGDDDYFLQPLPGTDIALMLAVMHIIIRDDLVDDEWVSKHTLALMSSRRTWRHAPGVGGGDHWSQRR